MNDFNSDLVIDLFKQRDELKRENEALKQRIERLEEAVDAYRKAYTPDGLAERKAKEAKP